MKSREDLLIFLMLSCFKEIISEAKVPLQTKNSSSKTEEALNNRTIGLQSEFEYKSKTVKIEKTDANPSKDGISFIFRRKPRSLPYNKQQHRYLRRHFKHSAYKNGIKFSRHHFKNSHRKQFRLLRIGNSHFSQGYHRHLSNLHRSTIHKLHTTKDRKRYEQRFHITKHRHVVVKSQPRRHKSERHVFKQQKRQEKVKHRNFLSEKTHLNKHDTERSRAHRRFFFMKLRQHHTKIANHKKRFKFYKQPRLNKKAIRNGLKSKETEGKKHSNTLDLLLRTQASQLNKKRGRKPPKLFTHLKNRFKGHHVFSSKHIKNKRRPRHKLSRYFSLVNRKGRTRMKIKSMKKTKLCKSSGKLCKNINKHVNDHHDSNGGRHVFSFGHIKNKRRPRHKLSNHFSLINRKERSRVKIKSIKKMKRCKSSGKLCKNINKHVNDHHDSNEGRHVFSFGHIKNKRRPKHKSLRHFSLLKRRGRSRKKIKIVNNSKLCKSSEKLCKNINKYTKSHFLSKIHKVIDKHHNKITKQVNPGNKHQQPKRSQDNLHYRNEKKSFIESRHEVNIRNSFKNKNKGTGKTFLNHDQGTSYAEKEHDRNFGFLCEHNKHKLKELMIKMNKAIRRSMILAKIIGGKFGIDNETIEAILRKEEGKVSNSVLNLNI